MDLSSVIALRRRLLRNRLGELSPNRRFSRLLLIVAGVIAVLVGGHLAAPTLMAPPIDLATPRGLTEDELPAGAAALEAAFWMTALAASVLNFRVLELLFRRRDIVALQRLPIEPRALFADRFAAAITEAVVCAAGLGLFFVPLVWHGGQAAAVASIAMLAGGLLVGQAISLAVMLHATRSLIPRGDGSSSPALSDAYVGPGQILLYAPAFALAGVVIVALFWKLLVGEPLRLGYFSEPFWIGSAIVAAIGLTGVFVAYRAFVADYFRMAPRFHEADAAEFHAIAKYQESSYDRPRRSEFGLDESTRTLYRALIIDDDRRMAGKRIGYAVALVLAGWALLTIDLEALPLWAVAVAPAVLMSTVVNPWHRLYRRVELLDDPLGLPVSSDDEMAAVDRATLREFAFVGGPYVLLVGVILGYFRGVGTEAILVASVVLLAGAFIANGVEIARRLGASTAVIRWLPTVLVVAVTAAAVVSLMFVVYATVVAIGLSLVVGFFSHSTE